MASHENLKPLHELKGSSDRSFGFVFTVLFLVIGLWPLFRSGSIREWAIVVGCILCLISIFKPIILRPLNHLWFKFSLFLQRLTNPLILGLLFYGIITPMATLLRLLGKDLLNQHYDPVKQTYWLLRHPPGPPPETMRNQF